MWKHWFPHFGAGIKERRGRGMLFSHARKSLDAKHHLQSRSILAHIIDGGKAI